MTHQSARVDIGNDRDPEFFQVFVRNLLGAPVRTDRRKLPHRQSFNVRPGGLIVIRIGAVVSYLGIGENDDLPGIRGISENLLVTGDGSVENNFPVTFAFGPITFAAEASSIFQRQDRLHHISEEWILKILSSQAR